MTVAGTAFKGSWLTDTPCAGCTSFGGGWLTDTPCARCGAIGEQVWLCAEHLLCHDCRQEKKMSKEIVVAEFEEERKPHASLEELRGYLELAPQFVIETQEDREACAGVIAELKGHVKSLADERKAATGPIEAGLRKIRSWFKEPEALAQAALDAFTKLYLDSDRAMTAAAGEAAQAVQQAVAAGDSRAAALAHSLVNLPEPIKGMTVRKLWRARVVNAGMLAPELLMPNQKAIDAEMRRQLDEGVEPVIAGVICEQVDSLAVTS